MGETDLRGNIIQGDGVYKHDDAGKTWTPLGLEKTQAIARIRVHPANPDLVYVAALGNPYGPNPERGVFRSKDGGKTWERVLFRDDKTGAVDLVDRPEESRRPLRRAVGGVPHAVLAVERRPGQRPLQDDRRRRHLDRADEEHRAAEPIWGKVGVRGVRRRHQSPLRDHRSEGRRHLHVRRCRRDVEAVNEDRRIRQRAFYYSRIYADPQVKDTVLRPERQHLSSPPTPARRWKPMQRAARRQPRSVDRAERLRTA